MGDPFWQMSRWIEHEAAQFRKRNEMARLGVILPDENSFFKRGLAGFYFDDSGFKKCVAEFWDGYSNHGQGD